MFKYIVLIYIIYYVYIYLQPCISESPVRVSKNICD